MNLNLETKQNQYEAFLHRIRLVLLVLLWGNKNTLPDDHETIPRFLVMVQELNEQWNIQ